MSSFNVRKSFIMDIRESVRFQRFVSKIKTLSRGELKSLQVENIPFLHYMCTLSLDVSDVPFIDEMFVYLQNCEYDIDYAFPKRLWCISGVKYGECVGFTALHTAIAATNIHMVRSLIQNGARTDIRDNSGLTLIHWAILTLDKVFVSEVFELGITCEITDLERCGYVQPILHMAVNRDLRGMVSYLIENKIVSADEEADYKKLGSGDDLKILSADKYNRVFLKSVNVTMKVSPLSLAIYNRNEEMVRLLLKCGSSRLTGAIADLHICIKEGYVNALSTTLMERLSKHFANDKMDDDWSLFRIHPNALREDTLVDKSKQLISCYVNAGWDVNSISNTTFKIGQFIPFSTSSILGLGIRYEIFHYTLLHVVCVHGGNKELIRFLIKLGADVNLKTHGIAELSPLHIAILRADWDVATMLMECGASANIIGGCSHNFMNFTRHVSRTKGIQREHDTYSQFTPTELLLRLGLEKGLRLLYVMIANGISWNGANELHLAIEGKNFEFLIKVLCELRSQVIPKEELFWIKMKDNPYTERASLCPILDVFMGNFERKIETLDALRPIVRAIRLMVSIGYDCNIHKEYECPIIFRALEIDLGMRYNEFLLALLEFDHINLNLSQNLVEFVIKRTFYGHININNWEESRACLEIEYLLLHGVDVSMIEFSKVKTQFYIPFRIVKLLVTAGAKIDPNTMHVNLNRLDYNRMEDESFNTMQNKILTDFKRTTAWMESHDKINLKLFCRQSIVKMCKNIGMLRECLKVLPKDLCKDKLLLHPYIPQFL